MDNDGRKCAQSVHNFPAVKEQRRAKHKLRATSGPCRYSVPHARFISQILRRIGSVSLEENVARIILFDVQHGFCAFAKSPTGCTLLIDCGKGHGFSPVEYLLENELGDAAVHSGYRLTQLVVSHPHEDHIDDIGAVISKLPPCILLRQKYLWEAIKQAGNGNGAYESLDLYSTWQQSYSAPAPQINWGMKIDSFRLTPAEALQLGVTNYVNNSGIVIVLTFYGANFNRKIVFGADVEQAGWVELLKKPGFKEAVKDPDFYVASHHGHGSGFSTELFNVMGTPPYLNLVSVTDCDEHVDSRYSDSDHARGVMFGGQNRYMLTTRADGSIFIDIDDAGNCTISLKSLMPNLVKMAFGF
jgi:beta-lactamase superfamily II metal-dependent hydrolase